jgi:hypothetical protein
MIVCGAGEASPVTRSMDATRTAHRHDRATRRNPCVMRRSKSMRMSIALPIAAALAAAAIGLSSPTSALAKPKTLASCNAGHKACLANCRVFTIGSEIHRGCTSRCMIGAQKCGGAVVTGTGGKSVATGVKPGGGAWSSSTASGQPFPKGPVLAKPAGTNGGGLQVVKPAGTNGGGLQVVKPLGRR